MKSPGEGICRVAIEEQADIVIIGTRGLSTVKRAVLGSVSDYVVRNSGIPTLVIPYKKEDDDEKPKKEKKEKKKAKKGKEDKERRPSETSQPDADVKFET